MTSSQQSKKRGKKLKKNKIMNKELDKTKIKLIVDGNKHHKELPSLIPNKLKVVKNKKVTNKWKMSVMKGTHKMQIKLLSNGRSNNGHPKTI